MSDYRRRMLAITDELHTKGVGRYTSAPPIFRLAWRLGYDVKPPLYQSFSAIAISGAVWFAVVWGLFAWFPTLAW
ncbi:hypothetical protein BH23GEM2_BH23GEM2_23140 [soil metagenome]